MKDSKSHDAKSCDLIVIISNRPYKPDLLFSPYLYINIILIIISLHLHNKNFEVNIRLHVTVLGKHVVRSRAIHVTSVKCFIFT